MTAQANGQDFEGGEQLVCREGGNTIDTGRIPVIFVPGVMGSRLHFTGINRYWDPDSMLSRMPHWITSGAERVRRDFSLSNRAVVMSTGNDLDETERERGWAGVAWDFYGTFLQHMRAQNYGAYDTPIYAIGYDWRQSNNTSGDAVCTRINEILEAEGAQKFILLSHSMGGLVTRAGMHRNPGVAAKLLGVCHIALPVTGAAVAVRRMFTGATYSGDGFAMMALLGNNRRKFQTIVSALPGPMQLVANQDFTKTDGSGWYSYRTFEEPSIERSFDGLCWTLYAQPNSPPGLLAPVGAPGAIAAVPRREFGRRLNEARNFHMALRLWKHRNTWTFYGDGNTVDTSVYFELPPVHAELAIGSTLLHSLHPNPFHETTRYSARRADGTEVTIPGSQVNPADRGCVMQRTSRSDGTVPVASARALFPGQGVEYRSGATHHLDRQRQFYADGGQPHDQICKHPKCRGFVDELITHLVGSA